MTVGQVAGLVKSAKVRDWPILNSSSSGSVFDGSLTAMYIPVPGIDQVHQWSPLMQMSFFFGASGGGASSCRIAMTTDGLAVYCSKLRGPVSDWNPVSGAAYTARTMPVSSSSKLRPL